MTVVNHFTNMGRCDKGFHNWPTSFDFTTTKVFMDRLEKYAHFVSLKSGFTSKTVAESFMKNVVKLQDMPKTIVLDRDMVFTGEN